MLPCDIASFPCKYLGLPLSLHRLSNQQLWPLVDKIADRLPNWKADLLNRAGRRILVQHVLTGMCVYTAMAIDFPMWVIKEIDKIRKGFLWRGRREVKGGHCMVAWGKVCRPLNFGGLGISSLPELCWALRMRWLWLQRTDPTCLWNNLPVHVPSKAKAFFSSVLVTEIGDGANTYFWSDKWINARSVSDIAPRLLLTVPKRIVSKRTVREALTNRRWVSDIKGALTWGVLVDYLHLWNAISDVVLQPNSEDKHIFSIASNGQYSACSAYKGFFTGSVGFEHYKMVWKSWAPPKCRFFLWLVAHNRCWTADRLEKRGLNHPPRCPLCDQEPETINHLLVSCSFSRLYWYITLRKFGLHILAPIQDDTNFLQWW